MATLTDDGEMVYRITNDGFVENAVYHTTIKEDLLTHKTIFTLTQQLELFFLNF